MIAVDAVAHEDGGETLRERRRMRLSCVLDSAPQTGSDSSHGSAISDADAAQKRCGGKVASRR